VNDSSSDLPNVLDIPIRLLHGEESKRIGDYAPNAKLILFVNVASE
jgi:hypothetical protein